MKKLQLNIFLLIILFISTTFLKGQDSSINKYVNFIKPTPEVAKLISSIDFPIAQTSGSLDLKIPLYTIKTKSLEVPITLSYKNSGFQVNEESSNVGFGWDLTVGGRIYRQVRGGTDDEYANFRKYRQSSNRVLFPECPDISYNALDAFEACNDDYKYMFSVFGKPVMNYSFNGNVYNLGGMGMYVPIQNQWPFMSANTLHINAESEADIFYYNYPSGSGKFFYGDQFKIKTIPFTKEKITENTITDTQGNIFYFNDKADVIDLSTTNITQYFINSNTVANIAKIYNNSYSMLLSKIVTTSNDIIQFTYSDVEYTKFGPTVFKFRKSMNTIPSAGQYNLTPITNGYFDSEEINKQKIKTKKIETITLNNKIIAKFIYSDLPRKDLFFESIYSPKSLSKILIFDEVGNTVNTIEFNQSYFGQNSTIQNAISETSKYYRLKLNSLKNNGAIYAFDYFDEDSGVLPNKSIIDKKDHWGFFNGKIAHYRNYMPLNQIFEEIGANFKSPDLEKTKITVLKSTTYPTKGKEFYEYDLNNVNGASIGGLRIKSIIKNDNNNGVIKKNIKYENGYVYMEPQYASYEVANAYRQNSSFFPTPLKYRFTVFSSTSVNDLLGFNGFPVYYSKITEENVNVNNQDLGKIIYDYTHFEDVIGDTGYTPSYYQTNISYDWKRNLPLQISYYRANEVIPFKKIINHYTFLDTPIDLADAMYSGPGGGFPTSFYPNESQYTSYKIYVNRLQTDIHNTAQDVWIYGIRPDDMKAEFEFSVSRLISAQYYKDKETIEENINGNLLTTVTNFKYDNPLSIQLTSKIITFPDKSIQETLFKYAHEKGNQLMIDKNMIGIPLETTTKQTIGATIKTLSRTETVYPTSTPTPQAGNLILPLSVKSYDLQNNPSTEVNYDQYDSKGNLQQYTTKSGIPVAIVWGYNGTQPMAKIEGATYAQVQNLAMAIMTASDTDASAAPSNDEADLLNALKTFRAGLPNYQVTTYTYDPLIGVRSITPPSGIREVYLYDTANRLMEVREQSKTGKLLKEFKYNYKN
ncbi:MULTISPECIES: hypothetical protein [unclassified Chryseobacterium]|uniref:hypothetical protein n=1 Tax=unclassified Chryseobacterium TaxID=2593645 RepID=UPI00226A131F|nr:MULTISPECIES: hypothetical protein [unclassified Chryseobacterium]